jgi:hypothetical protein
VNTNQRVLVFHRTPNKYTYRIVNKTIEYNIVINSQYRRYRLNAFSSWRARNAVPGGNGDPEYTTVLLASGSLTDLTHDFRVGIVRYNKLVEDITKSGFGNLGEVFFPGDNLQRRAYGSEHWTAKFPIAAGLFHLSTIQYVALDRFQGITAARD